MSYDITIALNASQEDIEARKHCYEKDRPYYGPPIDSHFNYTYNLSKFFHDMIVSSDNEAITGLQALDGLTNVQAKPILEAALLRVEESRAKFAHDRLKIMSMKDAAQVVGEPEFGAAYDAQNGWGSLIGAISLITLMYITVVNNQETQEPITIS